MHYNIIWIKNIFLLQQKENSCYMEWLLFKQSQKPLKLDLLLGIYNKNM